jgi:hypothetical protein
MGVISTRHGLTSRCITVGRMFMQMGQWGSVSDSSIATVRSVSTHRHQGRAGVRPRSLPARVRRDIRKCPWDYCPNSECRLGAAHAFHRSSFALNSKLRLRSSARDRMDAGGMPAEAVIAQNHNKSGSVRARIS